MFKIIILLIAVIGGVAGGLYLGEQKKADDTPMEQKPHSEVQYFYSKLDKPLIIPIFEGGKSTAMLISEVWLETKKPIANDLSSKKPKLRDEFLQVFAYYSSDGKLDGDILTPRIQAELRRDLTKVGRKIVGDNLHAVLINDLQRQDL